MADALDKVLTEIDAGLEQSLERLFAFLRIRSISTDPAYATDCRRAADHMAGELASIGFTTSVRPTAGHPGVIGNGGNGGPQGLFYRHYDVQPGDPLDLFSGRYAGQPVAPFAVGDPAPSEPRLTALPGGRKIIVARGACDD